MAGWHHRLNGHEFELTPGVGDGQGSLACCSPWGRKEWDTTEQLNWTECLDKDVRKVEIRREVQDELGTRIKGHFFSLFFFLL